MAIAVPHGKYRDFNILGGKTAARGKAAGRAGTGVFVFETPLFVFTTEPRSGGSAPEALAG